MSGKNKELPMNPCGYRTKHTSRVGCCSGCRLLFSSDSSFMAHRKNGQCQSPEEAGLVAHDSKSVPGETIWSLPSSGWLEKVRERHGQ